MIFLKVEVRLICRDGSIFSNAASRNKFRKPKRRYCVHGDALRAASGGYVTEGMAIS